MNIRIRLILSTLAAFALSPIAFAAEPEQLEQTAARFHTRLGEVLSAFGNLPSSAMSTLAASSPDGSAAWHLEVLARSGMFMVVGIVAALAVRRWTRSHFMYLFDQEPTDRAAKIGYLLVRAVLQLVNVAVFLAVAIVLGLAVNGGSEAARATLLAAPGVVATVWTARIITVNLLASDTPSHRLIPLSDDDAASIAREVTGIATVSVAILGGCVWMDALGLDPDAHTFAYLSGSLVAAILLAALAVRHRRAVEGLILGEGEAQGTPASTRLLARNWHALAGLYLIAAWLTTAARQLLGMEGAAGLVGTPILIALLGVGLYGVCLLVIDKLWAHHAKEDPADTDSAEADGDDAEFPEPPSAAAGLKPLAERGALLLVWAIGIWTLLAVWGIDVHSGDSLLVQASDVIIVVFFAYLAYDAVRILVDSKIESEGGGGPGEPGEEGGHDPATRLATLLPIFRNFLLITVFVIGAMIALSQMGVDIGPLFAGAGVVGLAVGFGAQTLVRDIFSGAFFLMDDAFRLGEYIDIGGVKGVVEKISIRSFQLRHHRGALHTIPFGEIKQLTNYSRDWALMKLAIRLTYDTDIEEVRKLIKNIGNELLEDPDHGEKFLQPLKSQGVYAMEDSAMIVRLKFMTRPGDQFELRKLIYARVRETFDREGIKFAHREVTVRIADDDGGELTDERKRQAAGAALPALEDMNVPAGSGETR